VSIKNTLYILINKRGYNILLRIAPMKCPYNKILKGVTVERQVSFNGKEGDVKKQKNRKLRNNRTNINREKLDLAIELLALIRADYSLSSRHYNRITFDEGDF